MTEEERMEWLKKEVKKGMQSKRPEEKPKTTAKILKFRKRKKTPKKGV